MFAQSLVARTRSHHREQHTLCARLEQVADDLPRRVDRQECLLLAREIYPAVKTAHDFEERELFPYLERVAGDGGLNCGLDRLRFEHWEDEAYAEELSDTLGRMGRGEPITDAEKISWMLRGFFDGVRRHMAFEAEHLLPMLNSLIETRASVSGQG